MLFFTYVLFLGTAALVATAAGILIADAWSARSRGLVFQWRLAGRLAVAAGLSLLLALGIVVVPIGAAGVRVSQLSGTLKGPLYAGTHVIVPFIQQVSNLTSTMRSGSYQAPSSSEFHSAS